MSDDQQRGEYLLPSTEAESERLEKQADLYGGTDFLDPFLTATPAAVLDVGCGTGYFSRYVAQCLPRSQVHGVDQNDSRLAYARHKGRSYTNLDYRTGELTALPFDDEQFDLVFTRFVLIHAPDPTQALQEMMRVTAPGGHVVAYEMVHDGIWFSPVKPAFAATLEQILIQMRNRGMEPSQGLHIGSSMIRAGLNDVRSSVVPFHFLGTDPMFDRYRRNWIETFQGIDDIMGQRFDRELVDRALAELSDPHPAQSALELIILSSGRK